MSEEKENPDNAPRTAVILANETVLNEDWAKIGTHVLTNATIGAGIGFLVSVVALS